MGTTIQPGEMAAMEASIRSLNQNCEIIFQAVFRLERNFQTMLNGLKKALGPKAKDLEEIDSNPVLTDPNTRADPAVAVPKKKCPKVRTKFV